MERPSWLDLHWGQPNDHADRFGAGTVRELAAKLKRVLQWLARDCPFFLAVMLQKFSVDVKNGPMLFLPDMDNDRDNLSAIIYYQLSLSLKIVLIYRLPIYCFCNIFSYRRLIIAINDSLCTVF